MVERRTRRSSQPTEALALLLESARQKMGVRTLTVATPQGRLLAGSGEAAEQVAALGASVDVGSSAESAPPVATWRLRVGREEVVITSLGRRMTADLGDGVRRILCGR